jgi:Transglycosylase SLT domain
MTVPNNPYPALASKIDPTVLRSIRQASQTTSTDFGLLMAQAARESGFHANAKSTTSSAAGLFQFVDSTWLDMVHRYGDKYGVGNLAQQISQTSSGKLVVADASTRQKILDLRANPKLSAELAGEYAKQNQTEIEQAIGRPLSRGDLYMAHFLGAGGATEFLKALDSKGNTVAAKLLPDAAAANPSIFYDASGRAKTVGEIYQSVAAKIEKDASAYGGNAPTAPAASFAVASLTDTLGGPSGFGTSVSALGHSIDWSGVKLSAPMLEALNVVALAALKMADDNSDKQPPQPPQPPSAPRPQRSI